MAIKNIKEIIDNRGYTINANDRKIFADGDLQSFFGLSSKDAIEFIIYDINDNQLPQIDGELVRYIPLNTTNISNYFLIAEGTVFQKYKLPSEYFIDVEKLLKEAGYTNGIFKVQITLINKRVGSEGRYDKLWIQQISPSRTEIRLQPLKDGIAINPELKIRYDAFVNDNDFIEDINIYLPEFVEKITPSEVLSFIKSKYTNEWYNKLVDEFKLGDFQKFITNIHRQFIQSVLNEFGNKVSSINDINYGKQKSTNVPIALSKQTLIDKLNRILAEIIDHYLPTQNIIESAVKVIDFLPSEDPVGDILQRKNSDIEYKARTVETEVRALIYPEVTEKRIALEKLINDETPEEKIIPVIVEIGEPPYIAPPAPQDVTVIPTERIIVTPIIIEPNTPIPIIKVEPVTIAEPITIIQPEPTPQPIIINEPETSTRSDFGTILGPNVFDQQLPEFGSLMDDEFGNGFISSGESNLPRLL
jgi:hypothetical protein